MKQWEKLLPWGLVGIAWMVLPGSWMHFHYGKWIGVYWIAFAAFSLSFFYRPILPKLKTAETAVLGLLAAGILAHLLWFRPSGYEFSLLDRWSFFLLILASWRGFSTGRLDWKDFWWPTGVALAGVSGYGLFQVISTQGQISLESWGSTFGYPNNSAQFVSLSLLLWWAIPRPEKAFWLFHGVNSFALAYLVFSRGRSAIAALLIGFLVLSFLKFGRRKWFSWRSLIPVAGAVIFALAGYISFEFIRGKSFADIGAFSLYQSKPPLLTYRWDVWKQTVKMIRAEPMGVGVDRFTFEFIPFHRQGNTISPASIAASPHNEFLRFLSEDGLVLSFLFLLAFSWLVLSWWKAGKRYKEVVLPLSAAFLVEMTFQFPWQNAYPFYLGALLIGAMASGAWAGLEVSTNRWYYSLAAILAAVFAYQAGKATVSRLFETSSEESKARLSCMAVPSNWQACLNYSRVLINKNDLPGARKVLERMLEDEPWNYAAIRHLGTVALKGGNRLEACFHIWRYDDIFHGRSDLRETYEKNCPAKWREYFSRRRPQRYYGPVN